MAKRVTAMLLAFVLALGLVIPVTAAETDTGADSSAGSNTDSSVTQTTEENGSVSEGSKNDNDSSIDSDGENQESSSDKSTDVNTDESSLGAQNSDNPNDDTDYSDDDEGSKDTEETCDHLFTAPVYTWAEDIEDPDDMTCVATFTCVKCHYTEDVDCKIIEAETTATCESEGVTNYTALCEFNGKSYTDSLNNVPTPKLKHAYYDPEFVWDGTTFETCTAFFKCSICGFSPNDGKGIECYVEHLDGWVDATCEQTGYAHAYAVCLCQGTTYESDDIGNDPSIDATIPALGHAYDYNNGEVIKEATCTEPGSVVYHCTREGCNSSISESLTVLGHDYNDPSVTWADDLSSCKAVKKCKRCGYEKNINCTISEESRTDPTCTEEGKVCYIVIDTDAGVPIPNARAEKKLSKLGHNYGDHRFEWSSDYTSCKCVYICTRDGCGHEESYNCTVTSKTTSATCTADGHIDYTAISTNKASKLSDSKQVTLYATGHVYNNGVITREPTCTTDGTLTYTCKNCGDSYTEAIKATGTHVCNSAPSFTWGSDHSCKASFYCSDCGAFVYSVQCEVNSQITQQATCTSSGTITYTATVGGTKWSNSTNESISSTGHSLQPQGFSWSSDYSSCQLILECANGCGYTTSSQCSVTSTKVDPTSCVDPGYEKHYATVSYNGQSYSDSKEFETGYSSVHTYGKPTFTWSNDCETCLATYVCSLCGNGIYTEECEVSGSQKMSISAKTWYTDWTATSGNYADEKQQEHIMTSPTFRWSEDYTSCAAVFTCSECSKQGKVTCKITSKGSPATCTEDGEYVVTATVSGSDWYDVHTSVEPATGHDWVVNEYAWSADLTRCLADCICTVCGKEQTVVCTVAGSINANGSMTYTATVPGTDLSDTKTGTAAQGYEPETSVDVSEDGSVVLDLENANVVDVDEETGLVTIVDDNGNIIITDENGVVQSVNGNEVITDEYGNIFVIDENGEVTGLLDINGNFISVDDEAYEDSLIKEESEARKTIEEQEIEEKGEEEVKKEEEKEQNSSSVLIICIIVAVIIIAVVVFYLIYRHRVKMREEEADNYGGKRLKDDDEEYDDDYDDDDDDDDDEA